MPRPSLEQVRDIGNVQQAFRWDFTILPPSEGGLDIFNDIDGINFRLESFELPQETNEKIEIGIRGHKTQQSGIQDWSKSASLTFIETTPHRIVPFAYAWLDAMWSRNRSQQGGRALSKAQLQAVLKIDMLDVQDQRVGTWYLLNAFPEALDPGGTLDGTTSDAIRPVITFSFDRSHYEPA